MVAVFHHIGEPSDDHFTNSIEQILGYNGQITFDGAYESVYRHRDSLKDKDILMFVQGNTIGAEGVMDLKQIRELSKDYGFHIGWHGWTHRPLTELPDHAVIAELVALEGFIPIYAYPHGEYDGRVKGLVKSMGFKQAYSTSQGDDDPFSIKREYI